MTLKMSFGKLIAATTLVFTTACSPGRGNPKPPLHSIANPDASPMDTGSTDTGMVASVDTGMMSVVDTGLPLSASCMELSDCCAQLPDIAGQYKQQCLDQVAANVDAGCRSTLATIQGYGLCLPPDHDAGMRGDVGPLGPRCETLLACCSEIPIAFLRTQCENTARDGVETDCDTSLAQAQSAGICLDPPDTGIMDAGTSTTGIDAGTSTTGMDAGTSTTGMDAGTSTVADTG